MNIAVAIKHIPSLADELEVNSTGDSLDFDVVDFVLNEFDEHAIEQAVLIKEASGGSVTVVGVDVVGELDGILHTALAKGADRAMKIAGDIEPNLDSRNHARLLADCIKNLSPDLVLTGVQAADDVDGQIGPMLAAYLDTQYIGVVNGLEASNGVAKVQKEYSGGLVAVFEVDLPMVAGVQAASQPPRYAPISKIRQIAQTASIEVFDAGDLAPGGIAIRKLARPVSSGRAQMLEGDPKTVARNIIEIIKAGGLL